MLTVGSLTPERGRRTSGEEALHERRDAVRRPREDHAVTLTDERLAVGKREDRPAERRRASGALDLSELEALRSSDRIEAFFANLDWSVVNGWVAGYGIPAA